MRALRGVLLMCGAGLLTAAAVSGASAAGRAPNAYFRLDLPHAVMSPEPLGPPTHFERFGIQANGGTNWLPAPQQTAAAPAAPPPGAGPAVVSAPNPATANAAEPAPRTRTSHRRVAPYEARAAMAKPKPRAPITRWPCKSGGICAWQSPPGR